MDTRIIKVCIEEIRKFSYNSVMIFQTRSIHEMVARIRALIQPKTLIGLSGSMGAGKTTFISELLKDDKIAVSSPTYALYNSYLALGTTILHVDLYRVESEAEIDSTGYWDLFADSNAVILTEWVERLNRSELPLDWKKYFLSIKVQSNGERLYTLT